MSKKKQVIIGVGGPVGSGKTLLIERLTRDLSKDYQIGVITNDIYTKEDAQFLSKNSILPKDHIIGVETGGCPHTAIREDASMNMEAIDELNRCFPDLVDFSIYIIDVAQGEKIPRKAGQGMIKSDLFIINKTDLAPYVGADLDIMYQDTLKFRKEETFLFTNLKNKDGLVAVEQWIRKNCLLEGLE